MLGINLLKVWCVHSVCACTCTCTCLSGSMLLWYCGVKQGLHNECLQLTPLSTGCLS